MNLRWSLTYSIVFISILLSACSKPDYHHAGVAITADSHNTVVNLANIMLYSPSERFAEYSQRGQLRFLAYHSTEGIKVPGMMDKAAGDSMLVYGIELVPGMGDQVFSENHRQLQLYFLDYAQRYNRLLYEAAD
jgi:hypothetical protein